MGERRAGPPVAGWLMIVGGLALVGFMFTPWFDYGVFGGDRTAWEALERTDFAIFATGAVAALCGAWLRFGDVGPEGRFVALIGAAAAAVGAVLVIRRIASPPGDAPLRFGIYLALAALAIALIGGLIASISSWRSASAAPGPPAGG
jgi:hypothetical protein